MELNKSDEAYFKIYAKVLNFISFSKRSRKEVTDKIRIYLSKIHLSSGEKIEIQDRVISNLKNDGYLKDKNDEEYASSYIEDLKNSSKPFNTLNIRRFLTKKGVTDEIIKNVLEDIDSESIYNSVFRDAEKKIKYMKEPNVYLKKKKLMDYLYRKGYPFDIVSSVVDTLTHLQ